MEIDDKFANYQIIEDKAYTEDGILVYNIFVHNIPKRTTKDDFLRYFQNFGDVVSVRLSNDRNKKSSHQSLKIGFVNFKDPLCAAKVLQTPNHTLNKKRFWVRACDSWIQPDANVSPASGAGAASIEGMDTDEEALILNLNDDCLDVIFKHLPMHDQINLARCCSRLRDVFIMRAKVEYKILHLEDLEFLTLWQIRQFLQMTGHQIEKFGGRAPYHHFKRVIEFLGLYCVNAKSVSIISERLTLRDLRKLFRKVQKLEELRLHDADLKDECILALKKLKNLKSLSLEENYSLLGDHLKDLTHLENLSLNACKCISPRFFKRICENLKNLRYLDIQECSQLNVMCMTDMVKNLQKLETLKLSCDNGQVDCIATLASLKHLYLYNEEPYGPVPSRIFVELAKHRASHLETLAVRSYNCLNQEKCSSIGELRNLKELICPNNDKFDDKCLQYIGQLKDLEMLNIKNCKGFTASGLLNLIQNCHKLQVLNVSNCKQLNGEFAQRLLDLFKAESKKRELNKPLKIVAHMSGIPHFSVNTPEFASATDLLTISFEHDIDSIYTDDYGRSDSDIDDFFHDYDDDYDDDDNYMFYPDPDVDDDDDFNVDDDNHPLDMAILRRFLFNRFQHNGNGDIQDILF